MLTLIIGRKGTGKTTLLKRRLADVSRLLIFDPNDEYADLVPGRTPDMGPADEAGLMRTALDILGWPQLAGDLRAAPAVLDVAEPETVVIRQVHDFAGFLVLVRDAQGWTIAIDEAHHWWETHRRVLDELVRTMRHREQDWYLVSHRAAWVPRSIQSQIDRLVIFQTTSGGDIKYLEAEYAGVDGDQLRGLGIGEHVDLDISASQGSKRT